MTLCGKRFQFSCSDSVQPFASACRHARTDSFFAIMYRACKSQSFRHDAWHDKRPLFPRVVQCHGTKPLRIFRAKFGKEGNSSQSEKSVSPSPSIIIIKFHGCTALWRKISTVPSFSDNFSPRRAQRSSRRHVVASPRRIRVK